MKVIDLDSHSRPRAQDYVVEPEYSHLKPHTFVDARGNARVIFDNKIIFKFSKGETKDLREAKSDFTRADYDGSFRYEQVKEAGIDLQFITAGDPTDFAYVDAKVGAAFCRAYNNFLYNTFVKPHLKTFSALPQLPLQDIREAIKELERCVKDLGVMSFVMPTNWNGIDMADPHWWNFYDRVRELGISGIIIHAATLTPHSQWVGKERLGVLGPDGTRGRRILSHPFEYCTNIVNLVFGGMMDSFPEFRFAFLEEGTKFAIVLKERIEENLEQVAYLRDMLTQPLERYFDRLYFQIDESMVEDGGKSLHHALEHLGEDHLFLGTDYSHHDTLSMGAKLKGLNDISVQVSEKILGGNAASLIGEKLS